jgi:hypothetical protein
VRLVAPGAKSRHGSLNKLSSIAIRWFTLIGTTTGSSTPLDLIGSSKTDPATAFPVRQRVLVSRPETPWLPARQPPAHATLPKIRSTADLLHPG